MLEKRKFVRVGCEAPLYYREEDSRRTSQAVDISRGGIGLVAYDFIPVDKKLELQMSLSGATGPCRAVGKVAWIRRVPTLQAYRVGVEFTDIFERTQEEIIRHIENLI